MTTPEEPSEPSSPGAAIPSAAWAAPGPARVPPPPSAPWSPPSTVGAAPQPRVNGFAVASLVLGLTCWCGFLTGILAVIFGNVALGQIARSEGRATGRGLAIAGIVLGWVSIAVLAGIAIAWFAYNFSNG